MNVLIQKNDTKSQMWARALKKHEINLIPMKGSPIKWFSFYIYNYVKKKPKAIILRYLNDYPNLVKTILRFFSESFTLILANFLKTKIIWICHNIDKETDDYFPSITRQRRKMIQKYADHVLVLDSLLVGEAQQVFTKSKIDYISFGMLDKVKVDISVMNEIKKFILDNDHRETIFGLTVGTINYKTLHYKEMPRLISEAKKNGINLKMIVCGPIGSYLKKNEPSVYNFMVSDEDILFINEYVNIDEADLYGISFAFKSNLDKSVPLSYYTTASAKLPVLAIEDTFSAKMVLHYNIGCVLNKDYSNIKEVLNEIQNKDFNFEEFLSTHSWKFAAQKFIEIIKTDVR